MLADIGGDNRISVCLPVKFFHDIRACQFILLIIKRISVLEFIDFIKPFFMFNRLQLRIHIRQNHLQVTDNRTVRMNILVDLCRINIKLQYLRILCKCFRIADHTV